MSNSLTERDPTSPPPPPPPFYIICLTTFCPSVLYILYGMVGKGGKSITKNLSATIAHYDISPLMPPSFWYYDKEEVL